MGDRKISYNEAILELSTIERDIEAQIEFFDDDDLTIKSSIDGNDLETSNSDKDIIVMELRNKLRGIRIAKRVMDKLVLGGAEAEKIMSTEEKTVLFKIVGFIKKVKNLFNFKK